MTTQKPTLPESPLPALLDHDGRFQALYPEELVAAHGETMVAYERARILDLLDSFARQCQAQAEALGETGHADQRLVNAQHDAVRLLHEAINKG
jgi:erythromycin esterase-like protein